jgi:hypothetical protein
MNHLIKNTNKISPYFSDEVFTMINYLIKKIPIKSPSSEGGSEVRARGSIKNPYNIP